jgi:hypothetical protein
MCLGRLAPMLMRECPLHQFTFSSHFYTLFYCKFLLMLLNWSTQQWWCRCDDTRAMQFVLFCSLIKSCNVIHGSSTYEWMNAACKNGHPITRVTFFACLLVLFYLTFFHCTLVIFLSRWLTEEFYLIYRGSCTESQVWEDSRASCVEGWGQDRGRGGQGSVGTWG